MVLPLFQPKDSKDPSMTHRIDRSDWKFYELCLEAMPMHYILSFLTFWICCRCCYVSQFSVVDVDRLFCISNLRWGKQTAAVPRVQQTQPVENAALWFALMSVLFLIDVSTDFIRKIINTFIFVIRVDIFIIAWRGQYIKDWFKNSTITPISWQGCAPCDETDECNVNYHEAGCSLIRWQWKPFSFRGFHGTKKCNHFPFSPTVTSLATPDLDFCLAVCATTGLSSAVT